MAPLRYLLLILFALAHSEKYHRKNLQEARQTITFKSMYVLLLFAPFIIVLGTAVIMGSLGFETKVSAVIRFVLIQRYGFTLPQASFVRLSLLLVLLLLM